MARNNMRHGVLAEAMVTKAAEPQPPPTNGHPLSEAPDRVPVLLTGPMGLWAVGYRNAGIGGWFILYAKTNCCHGPTRPSADTQWRWKPLGEPTMEEYSVK